MGFLLTMALEGRRQLARNEVTRVKLLTYVTLELGTQFLEVFEV